MFVVGAGTYLFTNSTPPDPTPSLNVKLFTSSVGVERYPTWSPDGSLIAYERPQAGNTDIFVKPASGGEPIQLTSSPADEISPRWSPDGKYIAFLSDRGPGTKVYVIPPLGGAERELVDTNRVPLNHPLGPMPWSPDGQHLLFSRLGPSGEMEVWKVNLSTAEETQMTEPPPGGEDLHASWSFDGERIAFARRGKGTVNLFVLPGSGGEARLLLGGRDWAYKPAWAPDNQHIVFGALTSGAKDLWEVEVASGRLRQLTSGVASEDDPVASRQGSLAYARFSEESGLYLRGLEGEAEQRLTLTTRDNFFPRVSPDGKRIAYQSDRTGNNEIWLFDLDTSSERQLTDQPAMDIQPDWSPDGREIVFLSNRDGDFHVWVMNVDHVVPRRLTDHSILIRGTAEETYREIAPRWSPDGKAIGYIGAAEQGETLWVVDQDGENARSYFPDAVRFDWYRDSRHVVYTRVAEGDSATREMVVANLESGKEFILYRGDHWELDVAPEGSAVSYCDDLRQGGSAPELSGQALFLLRLAPPNAPGELPRALGQPQRLTDAKVGVVLNGGWSPDGKKIVFSRMTQEADIHIAELYQP